MTISALQYECVPEYLPHLSGQPSGAASQPLLSHHILLQSNQSPGPRLRLRHLFYSLQLSLSLPFPSSISLYR